MNSRYNCGEISIICITSKTIQRQCGASHICSHLIVTQQWCTQVPLAVMEKSPLMEQALSTRRHRVRYFQDYFLFDSHPAATPIRKINKIPCYGTVIESKTLLAEMRLKRGKAICLFQTSKIQVLCQLLDGALAWLTNSAVLFPLAEYISPHIPHVLASKEDCSQATLGLWFHLFLFLLWTLRNSSSMHMISLLKRVINVFSSTSLATWLYF